MVLEVTVPALLSDCVGGVTTVSVDAPTLAGGLERLMETWPLLRVHLYDERRALRPHVRIFYNGENIAWLPSLDIPLKEGDRLYVLQAVSGG